MPKSRPPYLAQFRQLLVELVRSGRSPDRPSREFEPSVQTIRNWVAEVDHDSGRRSDGLDSVEREVLSSRLRREMHQLKMEREILSRATAWFDREAGSMSPSGSSSWRRITPGGQWPRNAACWVSAQGLQH